MTRHRTLGLAALAAAVAGGLLTPSLLANRSSARPAPPAPRGVGPDVADLLAKLHALEGARGSGDPKVTEVRHLAAALLYAGGHTAEATELAAFNAACRHRAHGTDDPRTAGSRRQLAAMSGGGPQPLRALLQ